MIFREPKSVLFTLIHAIIFAMILSFIIKQDFIEGACSGKKSNTCNTKEDLGKCSNDSKKNVPIKLLVQDQIMDGSKLHNYSILF